MESLQRKATKFILNDYQSSYKWIPRLQQLNLLPLTPWLEVQDILLLLSLIKSPDNFDLCDYITFVESGTRSSTSHKIRSTSTNVPKSNPTKFYYFNRIVRIWNSLPPVDLESSYNSLKGMLYDLYWDYFISCYDVDHSCSWSRVCFCSRCTS